MEIGIKDLAVAQLGALTWLRFLHFDDHLGAAEDFRRVADDFGSGGPVRLVARTDPGAGAAFHDELMSVLSQLLNALRRQADAVFVIFDLSDRTDNHARTSIERHHLAAGFSQFSPTLGPRAVRLAVPRPLRRHLLLQGSDPSHGARMSRDRRAGFGVPNAYPGPLVAAPQGGAMPPSIHCGN